MRSYTYKLGQASNPFFLTIKMDGMIDLRNSRNVKMGEDALINDACEFALMIATAIDCEGDVREARVNKVVNHYYGHLNPVPYSSQMEEFLRHA